MAVDGGLEIVPWLIKWIYQAPIRIVFVRDWNHYPFRRKILHAFLQNSLNIGQVMEQIVKQIPPSRRPGPALAGCHFWLCYDVHIKVLLYMSVLRRTGTYRDVIRMMATGATFTVVECGYMRAGGGTEPSDVLSAGEVGLYCCFHKICSGCSWSDITLQSSGSRTFARLHTEPLANGVQRLSADGAHYLI